MNRIAKQFFDDMDRLFGVGLYQMSEKWNKGSSLVDNYNWRALAIGYVIEQLPELNGLTVSRARHGVDATLRRKSKVEIELKSKTWSSNSLSSSAIGGEFDKQHEDYRRESVINIRHLAFGAFEDGVVVPTVVVYAGPKAMTIISDAVISIKQSDYLKERERKLAASIKPGRDSITLNLNDITGCLHHTQLSMLSCFLNGELIETIDLLQKIGDKSIKRSNLV